MALLKKIHVEYDWTSNCQKAFDGVNALCCAPVLAAPDFMSPFKLEVDTSM